MSLVLYGFTLVIFATTHVVKAKEKKVIKDAGSCCPPYNSACGVTAGGTILLGTCCE